MIPNQVRPGDLFFTTSDSIPSKIIRQDTWGKYSHVQLITEYRSEFDMDVITADAGGVVPRAVREEEYKQYAILTCREWVGLDDADRKKIVQTMAKLIGADYDYYGLVGFKFRSDTMQMESEWFCSEAVFWAYSENGIWLQERIPKHQVDPHKLYISPLLEVVVERNEGGEMNEDR